MPLSRSPEFGRAIFATIRQPMLVLDPALRVVLANRAFHRLFETTGPETEKRLLSEIAGGSLATPALVDALERVTAGDDAIAGLEMRPEPPRAGVRILTVDIAPIVAGSAPVPHVLMAFEDMTERVRIERERMRYAHEMERSNRDLEDFAHAASHDLQEPLRKVRAFADRLARSFDEAQLDERQRAYLERLHAATLRMQLRIDDLLRLARVSRATRTPRPLDLAEVVTAVLGDMEGHLADNNASVDVGNLPTIEADASQMELLFQNLVSNSLKYRKPDVAPAIRITSEPIDGPPDDPRAWHEIAIADNGIGFEQAYAEQIFRPFERLHAHEEYEGSGIGLSVCRRVVEIHGGRIRADAAPANGATFSIQLPATQNASEV